MRTAVRRILMALTLAALLAVGWFGVEGGKYLLHEDPLRHADAIFVLGGSRFERPLEAVDLYKAGYARFILLSAGLQDAADDIVRARGVPLPRDIDVVINAVVQLGIRREDVAASTEPLDNTAAEADHLRAVALQRGWHTVIVVTSRYHTRRAGFAVRRALKGTGIDVIVRASRYDQFDPAHWWRTRPDIRYMISEWQKLVAYRLGLAG
jgi:uncharacterized SAM-binding protein YcdF (DUF218 family)